MAPTDETAQFEPKASPFGTTPPTRPPAGPGPGAAPNGRMPRWLPRAMVLALSLVAVFQLGSWAFHQLIGLLINILIAFFLALAIEPAVSWMASKGMRRGFATFLVFVITLVGAAGFVTLLGSMLAGQIIKMVEDFPAYLDSVIRWINTTFHTELKRVDIQEGLLRSDWLQKYVQNSATGVLDVSAQVLGGLFQLLTIALFSFYFAADGPRLRRALCSVLPPARQAEVLRAWEIAVDKTGGYLYSRGLMALISGAAHYVLLEYLDVPYAPALAVWVGLVSQFIPTIGTYLAGALPMLIAFTVNPWYALWVLVFVVIYQQFENYVLQPKLTAKTVDIHPAVAFGSVIAGTAILGAVGALIAIPAIATLQAFLGAYVKRYDVTDDPRVHGHRRRGSGNLLARLRKRPHQAREEDVSDGDVLTRVRKRLEEKLDHKRVPRQSTDDSANTRRGDDTPPREAEVEGGPGLDDSARPGDGTP
ncbi:AI-2E family transporter [Streptomyces sp. CA-210063]|uniref:AI-2E family transporter n=1 Tax=Streptomyces sp. CA-210063 TaxID=2801029 RepID=UPI00214ADE23|nr:AI-2E family transporter [Streptomyces sp. CA-210063]UUU30482.1 AI-2E family transporter [Streptomyces sp. CA-210063]